VKLSAVPGERAEFSGPANIYEGEDEAIAALGEGKINKGDVIVLRNMGPSGGPGTVFACSFVAALNGAGIAEHVAVVTDGELSGLNRGIIVGQLMPESAAGGPLAALQGGDMVKIDIPNHILEVELPVEEIAARLAGLPAFEPRVKSGYLKRYLDRVCSASRGAVLKD